MGLAEFLRARLEEDEAAARPQAAWLREHEKKPGDWARFMFDPVIGPFGGQSPLRDVARGLYVGRMADPDRVLREVQAKRAILARHTPIQFERPIGRFTAPAYCSIGDDADPEPWPCADVNAIAAVYSDHPDYQPEWKP